VTGFTQSDITMTRGSISNFSGSGTTYTATFTRTANGNAEVGVAVGSYTDIAGNLGAGATKKLPAGIAGEPINLGLTDLSADNGGLTTVTIKNLPSDWTLNDGMQHADGTWTVQTTDVGSLTVTTPANFAGAFVLDMFVTSTQADGTTLSVSVANNVEAFAPGNPIFALSGDDNLTGSIGHDLFVFSQPIGHDVIHGFDAASDQIDLIGYADFIGFGDILAHTANDAAGNAVITLADGQSITLNGVDAASLTASDFVFDQTPVTENAGRMVISDGAILPLSGIIDNTGTIELNSTGGGTLLQLIQYGVTLEGGGQITLSDSDDNVISGTLDSVTLTNVDNTISGAGQIGAGQMTLINEGTIIATGTNALVIDTGTNEITNSGTLEATGSGGLVINTDIDNSGLIWAHGGNVTANGAVSGTGTALLDGTATIDFGAASSSNVTLDAAATGTIVLHDSFDFSGVVSGLNGDDQLDLADIMFGVDTSMSYFENLDGMGGTLSVTDGAHTANIALLGDYSADGFELVADNILGTLVKYHDELV
jgi:hypothetical protein